MKRILAMGLMLIFWVSGAWAWNIGSLATGQTTSYATGDDGYYKAGTARSFTRDAAKEIVTDNVTGLMWQDNSEAKTTYKNWSNAIAYCENLTLGGYDDWRLPTLKELHSITELGKYNPAINSAFQNTTSDYYWSSSTDASDTSKARYINFGYGSNLWTVNRYSNYVRCVRAGQSSPFDPSSLQRDTTTETVTDATTGLQWQDDSTARTITKTWSDAITYCESLTLGGYSDWRLPNANELYSIADDTKSNPVTYSTFTNVASDYYCSSTTFANRADNAWYVLFSSGYYRGGNAKSNSCYVRCVRAGQSVTSSSSSISSSSTQNSSSSSSVASSSSSSSSSTPKASPTFTTLTPSKSSATTGETITFTHNASDSDGSIVSYLWTFGDGTSSSIANPTKSYTSAGSYDVNLTVTDNDGLSASKKVAITISNKTYTLYTSVNSSTKGYLTLTPNKSTYNEGETVTITATPKSSSYVFKGWSGDASGKTNPLTITVSKNMSITANFDYPTYYTLTTTIENTGCTSYYGCSYGKVETSPSGSSYKEDSVVTLTATPYSGYQFDGWSGDAVGSSATTTVTMDSAKSVKATFSKIPIYYTISLSQMSNGTIEISPMQSQYLENSKVTIKAVPSRGYKLKSWSGDAYSYYESTITNPKELKVTKNMSIGATFEYDASAPSVSVVSPSSGATVTGKAFKILAKVGDNVDESSGVSLYIDSISFGKMTKNSDGNYEYALDTCKLQKGSHSLQIKATSINGIQGKSSFVSFSVDECTADKPALFVIDPVENDTLNGTVNVKATLLNLDTFKKAVLYVDGKPYGRVLTAAPLEFKLMTSALTNGKHSLKIAVVDSNGKLVESNTIYFYTQNEVWSENISANIISPTNGSTKATKFSVKLGVVSGEAITKADLYIDDEDVWFATKSFEGNSSNEVSIDVDLSNYASGTHKLKAYIETSSGTVGYSKEVSFTLMQSCLEGMECYGDAKGSMDVKSGWNLKAVPLKSGATQITPFKNNPLVESVFTYKNGVWKNYSKNGNKNEISSMAIGEGFWVKVSKDTKITFGSSSVPTTPSSVAIDIDNGWSLLGAKDSNAISTNIFKYCDGVETVWVYRDGWFKYSSDGTDQIKMIASDEGFWVKGNKKGVCE